MRLGLAMILMVLGVLLAGCGPDDASRVEGEEPPVETVEVTKRVTVERTTASRDTAPQTTVPTTENPDTNVEGGATRERLPGPAVPAEAEIKRTVGETATLDNGNSVTVFTGERGVPPQESVYEAREGMDFFVIEAEVCVSGTATEPAYFSPREFSLLKSSTVRRMASVPTKLPALRGSSVEPGECDRGYITFQVEEGEEPETVIFEGSSDVEWELERG